MFKSIIAATLIVLSTAAANANGQVSIFCDGWCDGTQWSTADTVTRTVDGVTTKISFHAEVKGKSDSRIKTIRVDGENLDIKSSLTNKAKIKAGHEADVVIAISQLVADAVNYRADNLNITSYYYEATVSGSQLHTFQRGYNGKIAGIDSSTRRNFFNGIKGGDRAWDALLDQTIDRAVRWTD